jgi:hypothetical protein
MFRFSIRRGSYELKDYVLDMTGYRDMSGDAAAYDNDIIIKSRNIIRSISIRNCDEAYYPENIYLFAFRNEISEALSKAFGIDFTKKRLTLSEINTILSDVKKNQ